jgi:AP-5 complex subunit beta-1
MAANSRARSVKLLEVPADFLIQATEQYLAPFVVSVIGEPLVNMVKGWGDNQKHHMEGFCIRFFS